MKKEILLAFILALASFGLHALEPLRIDTVIHADKQSKADIYIATKDWISQTFRDSKAVIDLDDPNSGIIRCKVVLPCNIHNRGRADYATGHFDCSFTIKIKEGRFKFEIPHFIHVADKSPLWSLIKEVPAQLPENKKKGVLNKDYRIVYEEVRLQALKESFLLISSLSNKVNNFTKIEDEDW